MIYGFNNEEVARSLKQFVASGKINDLLPAVQTGPQTRAKFNRIWWATAKTTITAATGGTAGTNYEVGSGDAYLLKQDLDDNYLIQDQRGDGDWIYKTVYNPFDTTIPINTAIVFPVVQDRYHEFYVLEPVKLKPHCQFTLDASLSTSDASKAATIEFQYGYGFDHASDSITVYNMLTPSSGVYEFYGASGVYGYADYDPQNDKWWIKQLNCPAS